MFRHLLPIYNLQCIENSFYCHMFFLLSVKSNYGQYKSNDTSNVFERRAHFSRIGKIVLLVIKTNIIFTA